MNKQSKVLVCDKCLTASCWYNVFICDEHRTAGTKVMTVAELRALPDDGNRENEDNWSDETMIRIYGNADRDF